MVFAVCRAAEALRLITHHIMALAFPSPSFHLFQLLKDNTVASGVNCGGATGENFVSPLIW
jgi:hypothetical protein